MHVLHAALLDLQHGFDHGMIRRRAFGKPAVQLDMLGARQRRLHRAVDAVDRRDRRTRARRAAAPPGSPTTLLRALLQFTIIDGWPRTGDRRRRGEFRDQQFRIVDLRHHQDFAELGRDRRLRRGLPRGLRYQRHAGAVAAHFEAERVAGHRAPGAIIDPAGLRLLRPPGVGGVVDLARRNRTRTRSTPRRRSGAGRA